MDKLYSLSAKSMKELLDNKEVSSVEITKSVIDRIEATDKDVEEVINKYAEQTKMSADEVKKFIKVEDVKESKVIEKTIDFLVENATIK